MTTGEKPEKVWDALWKARGAGEAWDVQSELIFRIIKQETSELANARVLEVGCGTGRISLATAKAGAKAYLLDTSTNALRIARSFFAQGERSAFFVQATGFQLPFRTGSFDVVWSAGLLEHFSHLKQVAMVDEMMRLLSPRGILLLIVPNRRALLYDLVRRRTMRSRTWPYGPEEPMTSRDLTSLGFERISSAGRYYQLAFLEMLPMFQSLGPALVQKVRSVLGESFLDTRGNFGYLLFGTRRCPRSAHEPAPSLPLNLFEASS